MCEVRAELFTDPVVRQCEGKGGGKDSTLPPFPVTCPPLCYPLSVKGNTEKYSMSFHMTLLKLSPLWSRLSFPLHDKLFFNFDALMWHQFQKLVGPFYGP